MIFIGMILKINLTLDDIEKLFFNLVLSKFFELTLGKLCILLSNRKNYFNRLKNLEVLY